MPNPGLLACWAPWCRYPAVAVSTGAHMHTPLVQGSCRQAQIRLLGLAKVPCHCVGVKGLNWPDTGTGQGPTSVVSTSLRPQVAWHQSSHPLFFSRRHLAQHMKAVLVTLSSVVQVTCDLPSSHHRPQLLLCPHILGLTHLPSGH